MSMHYSPEIVKLVMEERLGEARRRNLIHCCEEIVDVERKSSILYSVSRVFGRPSRIACEC
jgi:hypothetical protein